MEMLRLGTLGSGHLKSAGAADGHTARCERHDLRAGDLDCRFELHLCSIGAYPRLCVILQLSTEVRLIVRGQRTEATAKTSAMFEESQAS